MAEVVSYSATAFHELDLFFINADYTAVGVRIAVEPYNKAIRQ